MVYEYGKQKESWKEFEVVPCWKLVSVLTSVMSFVTSTVLLEHTVQGCRRLAVGMEVGGIVAVHPCTPSATSGGTCMEYSA